MPSQRGLITDNLKKKKKKPHRDNKGKRTSLKCTQKVSEEIVDRSEIKSKTFKYNKIEEPKRLHGRAQASSE